jgi:hypothetical protein
MIFPECNLACYGNVNMAKKENNLKKTFPVKSLPLGDRVPSLSYPHPLPTPLPPKNARREGRQGPAAAPLRCTNSSSDFV